MADIIKLTSGHDGFEFTALHAEPQGARRGGVIVIQEIFGIDAYVREDAERWSKAGFEVLAPSMFDRQQMGFVADHDPEGMQTGVKYAMANGRDNAMSDIQACIDALKAKGPVFIVGYCYGGTMVWAAAAQCKGLAAGASYYGGQIASMAGLPLACPVIVHLGRKDAHIPAEDTKATLLAAKPDLPVHIYDNAGHGFNNVGGPGYDAADAELARARTRELFAANGAG